MIDTAPLPVQRPAGAFRWVGLAAVALLLTIGGLDAAVAQERGIGLTGRSPAAARHVGNRIGGALGAVGSVLPGQRAFLAQVEQTEQANRSLLRSVSLVIALFAIAIAVRSRRRTRHPQQHGSLDLAGSVRRRGPPACELV